MRKIVFAILVASAAPSEARVWGAPADWVVTDSDTTCGMEREFEGAGDTTMGIVLDVDHGALLFVSNYNWTIKKGDKFDVIVSIDDRLLEGPATGFEHGIHKGFTIPVRDEHVNAVAAGRGIDFYRADTKGLIDSLKLDGTGAAVALMRRCLASVKARVTKERRDKAALAHIPADPFAVPVAPRSPTDAKPTASVASLISDEDYPASAVRANEQGRTGFRLTISTTGRVSNCVVTNSSGSAMLDSTTCRILRMRARFTPARDVKGEPVEGFYEGAITWSLSQLEPAAPLAK